MDPKFRIYFEGLPDDAIRSAEKVVNSLNKANDAQKRYSRERQQLARTERQERFRELSQEEQYQRLLQRREQLERRLAQARARGQGSRVDSLELSLARNRGQLRGIKLTPPPELTPNAPPVLGQAKPGLIARIGSRLMGQAESAGARGALGGVLSEAGMSGAMMAGAAAIGTVVTLVGSVATAMASAVKDSLRFADEVDDLADQTGLTTSEVIRVRAAAGAVGLNSNKAFGGISNIANMRSQALAGDSQAMALFNRYGVDEAKLRSGSSDLDIGSKIAKSLGAAGMLPTDAAPLRSLLGRRPEQIAAFLKAFNDLGGSISKDTEATVQRLAKINTKIEQAGNAWSILKVKFTGWLLTFYDENAALISLSGSLAKQFLSKVAAMATILPGSGLLLRKFGASSLGAAFDSLKESGFLKPDANGGNDPRTAKGDPFSTQLSAAMKSQAIQRFQQADNLAKIGIFTGASGMAQAGLAKAQFEKLTEMVRIQIETRNLMKVRL